MRYKTGEIVKLTDDGDTEFVVLATKDDVVQLDLKPGFDYFIKRIGDNKKSGLYQRSVFEKNIYEEKPSVPY